MITSKGFFPEAFIIWFQFNINSEYTNYSQRGKHSTPIRKGHCPLSNNTLFNQIYFYCKL